MTILPLPHHHYIYTFLQGRQETPHPVDTLCPGQVWSHLLAQSHIVPSIPFFKIPPTKGKYIVKHLADEYTGHSRSLSLTENE